MRVLQVSAEYFPLLKTGGLADVAGALPAALSPMGCEVRPVLPGFAEMLAGLNDTQVVAEVAAPWGESLRVLRGTLATHSQGGVPVTAYVVDAPALYLRPGGPYETPDRQPHPDNHRRFAAFNWAAARLAQGLDADWQPSLVHGHDWHAGLVPAYLALPSARPVPTLFTVHNLAYQGVFPHADYDGLGLPSHWYQSEGLEFFGQWSFMKAGLFYAQRINTVSPTYAQEIQTPAHGCGLDGLLRHRSAVVSGILNGIDQAIWSPGNDASLPYLYHAGDLSGKALNKAALQAEVGLVLQANSPLFIVVSRLTEQKGLPLVLAGTDALVQQGAQLLVLGSGDAALEDAFTEKARQHPGRVAVRLGYDEALSHRLFAGGDVTLVPSRFEPCGLTQMYGLAYGCVPLVRRVGGLADTVTDTDLVTLFQGRATGVVFDQFDVSDFLRAVERMLALYHRPADWHQVQKTGMRQPLGWADAARRYQTLYRSMV
jgi:starch synthase